MECLGSDSGKRRNKDWSGGGFTGPWSASTASQSLNRFLHDDASVASPSTIVTPGRDERKDATCAEEASLAMDDVILESMGCRRRQLVAMPLDDRSFTAS